MTEVQRKLLSLVFESKDTADCSSFFLKIVEFTTLSQIITQFILLLLYLSYKHKTRSSPTLCDFRLPSCPRHGDVLELPLSVGRQSCELSPAPERQD